jgi:hypothetical protein
MKKRILFVLKAWLISLAIAPLLDLALLYYFHSFFLSEMGLVAVTATIVSVPSFIILAVLSILIRKTKLSVVMQKALMVFVLIVLTFITLTCFIGVGDFLFKLSILFALPYLFISIGAIVLYRLD